MINFSIINVIICAVYIIYIYRYICKFNGERNNKYGGELNSGLLCKYLLISFIEGNVMGFMRRSFGFWGFLIVSIIFISVNEFSLK